MKLPRGIKRQVVEYLRLEYGEARDNADALKLSDLTYEGKPPPRRRRSARAVVEQVRALLGPIGAVAVQEEIGGSAALGMSPKRAQEEIRRGVEQAILATARGRASTSSPGPTRWCSR